MITSMDKQVVDQPLPKGSRKKLFALVALVVILIVAASAGTYQWQHSKFTTAQKSLTSTKASLTKQINQTNEQVTSLKSSNASLQANIAKLQAELEGPKTQADLKLTVESAKKYLTNPYNSATAVAVDISFTNNTGQTIDINTGAFKVVDARNTTYLAQDNRQVDCQVVPLPTGMTCLADQSVADGQTVRGALYFPLGNDAQVGDLTFVDGSQKIPLTLD